MRKTGFQKSKGKMSAGVNKDKFETYKDEIEKYPDLASLGRLHEIIKKVQGKQSENRDKLDLLHAAYKTLKDTVEQLKSEQNASANEAQAVTDAKPDEKKK